MKPCFTIINVTNNIILFSAGGTIVKSRYLQPVEKAPLTKVVL